MELIFPQREHAQIHEASDFGGQKFQPIAIYIQVGHFGQVSNCVGQLGEVVFCENQLLKVRTTRRREKGLLSKNTGDKTWGIYSGIVYFSWADAIMVIVAFTCKETVAIS